MAPLTADPATIGGWLVFLAIGLGFGGSLEMAGFSYAPNLAAQFYGRDMRVLKTMFTAIVTAMLLIFLSSAIGVLDFRMVSVNTTYLWPGIVGGLIMGVGFAIAGFCPGTSLAAAATGSRDALVYLVGLVGGMVIFGETVESFRTFWESSDLGRLTIPDWLGVPTGAVVAVVVIMAFGVFALVEWIEQRKGSPVPKPTRRFTFAMAGLAAVLVTTTAAARQPGWEEHWEMVAADVQVHLDDRDVHIAPGELLTLMHGEENVVLLDVREEAGFDEFHITGSRFIGPDLDALSGELRSLRDEPAGTIYVAIDTSEEGSTDAWRLMTAEQLPNAYILGGGTTAWKAVFGPDLAEAADPDPALAAGMQYEPKITEVTPDTAGPATSGGCG
jgi:rhodanese-related sulfurtransferase